MNALEGGLTVPVTWVKRTLCDVVQAREAHEVCGGEDSRGGGGETRRGREEEGGGELQSCGVPR